MSKSEPILKINKNKQFHYMSLINFGMFKLLFSVLLFHYSNLCENEKKHHNF